MTPEEEKELRAQPHRLVDGVPVLLTAVEIAEQEARDAAFAAEAPARLIKACEDAVEAYLDQLPLDRGYKGMERAATYVNSRNAQFKAEGIGYMNHRDDVWVYCYA